MSKMYMRLCDDLNSIGKLIPANSNIYDYVENLEKDHYSSIYLYTEEQKKLSEEEITVEKRGKKYSRKRGIKGLTEVYTNKLIFDFDSEEDIQLAQKDTIEACKRLKSEGINIDDALITFSGCKGFSIEILTDLRMSPDEVKNLAKEVAGDLKTFDTKVYNASRIFRLPYTRHNKTGLYKVPLMYNELKELSIDEIKDIAKDELVPTLDSVKMVSVPVKLKNKLNSPKKAPESDSKPLPIKLDIDLSKRPKGLSYWKYALLNGYFPPKTRSYALMILASTFKSQGMPEEVTYGLLKGASEIQSRRFSEPEFDEDELKTNIVDQVYSDLWDGGTYSEDNFPDDLKAYLLALGVPRQDETSLGESFKNSTEVFDTFKNFAENIEQNTIKTGIKPLDNEKELRITTSMLVGVLGAPSSGKTSCSLEIMKNASMSGQKVAFFSMDMGAPLVFQRLAQKVTGYNNNKLYELFKDKDYKEIENIRHKIDQQYGNVKFCFKTALTVQGIRSSIEKLQESSGEKIRIAVVDYLECINASISDPTAKISMISQELKDLATDLDICVLLLLQPPKRVGDPSKEILSYTDIKGAATVAQACSIVISLWRDGFNPKDTENDNYLSFAVIKNRMGKLSQIDCSWDGLTGKIGMLDDIERSELMSLRRKKKDEQSDDDF